LWILPGVAIVHLSAQEPGRQIEQIEADQRSMPTPTVFDVAKLAGVSIKTVSRVVNCEPNVRASTRERVDQAIEELDYRPNQAARNLASQRSQQNL